MRTHGLYLDALVSRYLTERPHENIEATERVVAGCTAAWGAARFPHSITLKETGAVVGMIEIRRDYFMPDARVGCLVSGDGDVSARSPLLR